MAMHRETGEEITGLAEIEQAVDEILDTLPGDRVMRADYGCDTLSLVDAGTDAAGATRIAQTVGDALRRFERRVQFELVQTRGSPGEITQTIVGKVRQTSERVTVTRATP